jgi:DNA-binding winged helix-turn-helix (wHTH) protein
MAHRGVPSIAHTPTLVRPHPQNPHNRRLISNRNTTSFKIPANPMKINPEPKSNRNTNTIPSVPAHHGSHFTNRVPSVSVFGSPMDFNGVLSSDPNGFAGHHSPICNHASIHPAALSSTPPRSTFFFPASDVRDEVPAMDGLRFDAYQVDLRTGELRKHGRKIRLAGRPFQILALLLEQPGELLTRKELQERLWPADTFVDFEHGVNAAIQTLRRALCDSHKNPRFIETLPRRGYRFIAAVERVQAAAATALAPAPAAPAVSSSPSSAQTSLTSAESNLVGQVATIQDDTGRNFVLLPVSEEIHAEMSNCESSQDALAISMMVAAEKLLLVNCGTRVQILDASNPALGCKVRILGGQFVGEKAFAPRANLAGIS